MRGPRVSERLPRFETARLRLCPRGLADTDACLAMDREPGVTRFVDGPWADPQAHRAFIEQRTAGPYPPGLGYWVIARRDDPASFLGWALLIPEDAVGPEVEIGWRLRPEAWGQGIATEAARPLLAYAFVTLKLRAVIAEIDAENAASCRVALKLGMTERSVQEASGRRLVLMQRLAEADDAAASLFQ
jgi:RimJ/RimL family protein N-acetyltransferase